MGRRSMDKSKPHGKHSWVEGIGLSSTRRGGFYRLIDHSLEGHFSIKALQRTMQLAAHCLNRDSKIRPAMSEVVPALVPQGHGQV